MQSIAYRLTTLADELVAQAVRHYGEDQQQADFTICMYEPTLVRFMPF